MEDDLNFFLHEWRPLFLLERKTTWFFSWKWKTILCFSNQRRSNFVFNGRCHLFFKWKTNLIFLLKKTSIFWKMEDDQYFSKWKLVAKLNYLAPVYPELGTAQYQLVLFCLLNCGNNSYLSHSWDFAGAVAKFYQNLWSLSIGHN